MNDRFMRSFLFESELLKESLKFGYSHQVNSDIPLFESKALLLLRAEANIQFPWQNDMLSVDTEEMIFLRTVLPFNTISSYGSCGTNKLFSEWFLKVVCALFLKALDNL